MAAEVEDQRCERVVVEGCDQLVELRGRAVEELGSQRVAAQCEQRLVRLVGHLVDAGPPRLAARFGERLLQQPAVLGLDDVPAGIGEEPLQAHGRDVGHHPVEALPVEVDDQRDVAEALGGRVGDGLPDVALVEFGVADRGDETRRRPRLAVGVEEPARHRAEQRRHRTETDRPGGEVGDVGILGARRVGLQPAAFAQGGEVRRSSSPVRYLMA